MAYLIILVKGPNEIMNHTNEDDPDGYVAEDLHKYESHSSVKNVKDRGIPSDSFNFQCVMAEDIKIRLGHLKIKMSSGYDNIPALWFCVIPIQHNMCIDLCLFSASLKRAEVTHLVTCPLTSAFVCLYTFVFISCSVSATILFQPASLYDNIEQHVCHVVRSLSE